MTTSTNPPLSDRAPPLRPAGGACKHSRWLDGGKGGFGSRAHSCAQAGSPETTQHGWQVRGAEEGAGALAAMDMAAMRGGAMLLLGRACGGAASVSASSSHADSPARSVSVSAASSICLCCVCAAGLGPTEGFQRPPWQAPPLRAPPSRPQAACRAPAADVSVICSHAASTSHSGAAPSNTPCAFRVRVA